MKRRARISDREAASIEDMIALQLRIMRQVQAIIVDLDPGTLGYHKERLYLILAAADDTRTALIARKADDAQRAKNGREAV